MNFLEIPNLFIKFFHKYQIQNFVFVISLENLNNFIGFQLDSSSTNIITKFKVPTTYCLVRDKCIQVHKKAVEQAPLAYFMIEL